MKEAGVAGLWLFLGLFITAAILTTFTGGSLEGLRNLFVPLFVGGVFVVLGFGFVGAIARA